MITEHIFMTEDNAHIIFNRQIAPGIMYMGIFSPEIASEATPGQFVMLRVTSDRDPLLRRPFSICRALNDGSINIIYRIVGRGTDLMAQMVKGDRVSVLGPLGQGYRLPDENQTPILVAGGMGIAPLIFLAHAINNPGMIFMAGFSTAGEIIPIDSICHSTFNIKLATDDGTYGYHGVVTDLLENVLNDRNNTIVYTCGPVGMLKETALMAIKSGIDCQVSLESAMACGLGACQGCVVPASQDTASTYFNVCKDGPVFSADLIDWKIL